MSSVANKHVRFLPRDDMRGPWDQPELWSRYQLGILLIIVLL